MQHVYALRYVYVWHISIPAQNSSKISVVYARQQTWFEFHWPTGEQSVTSGYKAAYDLQRAIDFVRH